MLAEARAASIRRGRFCRARPGAQDRDVENVCAGDGVKALGLETCATLGMLTPGQAKRLKGSGLDYYNHNLDTSPEFYGEIITTRTYQDRLDTLGAVRDAGINVCCGGIVGMGEDESDRVGMLHALATLPEHPQSVPINGLVCGEARRSRGGSRSAGVCANDRGGAHLPKSVVRLSATRGHDENAALASPVRFYGPKL